MKERFDTLTLLGQDSEGSNQGLGPKEKSFLNSPPPTRTSGEAERSPLSLDQCSLPRKKGGGRPRRREELQRERNILFFVSMLGAPWFPAPWTCLILVSCTLGVF